MHYIISSPMLNSPHTSLTLQKSMFAKSVSPLLKSFPFNINVISSYFTQFLTSPFQLRENDNCISSSSPNDSLIQQNCLYSKQIQLNNLAKISFTNSVFKNCTAILGSKIDEISGGAVFAYGIANISFDSCQFLDLLSVNAGAMNFCKCNSIFANCLFNECCALQNIGCIWSMGSPKYDFDCKLTIMDTNFTSNSAGKYCGAINANLSNAAFKTCIFQNNQAKNSVGAVALINKHLSTLNFVEFIENTCYEECPALWIQGSNDYMNEIHKISLDTVSFFGNVILNEKETKNAIRIYGIAALYYNNQICFDGTVDEFIRFDDNFVLGQYFRNVLFKNDTACPLKMVDSEKNDCPEYTNPFIDNRIIKEKIPLYMPIEIM